MHKNTNLIEIDECLQINSTKNSLNQPTEATTTITKTMRLHTQLD